MTNTEQKRFRKDFESFYLKNQRYPHIYIEDEVELFRAAQKYLSLPDEVMTDKSFKTELQNIRKNAFQDTALIDLMTYVQEIYCLEDSISRKEYTAKIPKGQFGRVYRHIMYDTYDDEQRALAYSLMRREFTAIIKPLQDMIESTYHMPGKVSFSYLLKIQFEAYREQVFKKYIKGRKLRNNYMDMNIWKSLKRARMSESYKHYIKMVECGKIKLN